MGLVFIYLHRTLRAYSGDRGSIFFIPRRYLLWCRSLLYAPLAVVYLSTVCGASRIINIVLVDVSLTLYKVESVQSQVFGAETNKSEQVSRRCPALTVSHHPLYGFSVVPAPEFSYSSKSYVVWARAQQIHLAKAQFRDVLVRR